MTCREFAEFVWKYISGELPPDERFRFDAHLAICPECVHYLSTYEATIRMGREALLDPDAELPDEVPEELVQAILHARSGGRNADV
jgi:anti-sigma factor RsiW